jgi:hypothetical protein
MAFAETSDVVARIGRSLSTAEETKYAAALEDAQALLEVAIDRTETEMETASPALRGICVSVAMRIASNPHGMARHTQALGAFSETKSFQAEGAITLTEQEELLARRAVWGTNTSNGPDDAE